MNIETWRRLGIIFMWVNGSLVCLNFVLIFLTMLVGLPPQPIFYLCTIIGLIGWYSARTIKERCDLALLITKELEDEIHRMDS